MVDSGATALFINKQFVKQNNMEMHSLRNPIVLYNIDGSINKAGSLTDFVRLTLTIGSHTDTHDFLVTDLGPENLILGLPWLKKVNPVIDWESGEMELPSSPEKPNSTPISPFEQISANRATRRACIKAGIIEDSSDELWMCAGFTLSTELAAKANESKAKRTFEEMVPEEYRKYTKVFSEVESQRLPEHQPWEHTIDLKEGAPATLKSKV